MNSESINRMPWLALGVLWSAYALLGWYLAAHHIVWIVGAVVIAVMLMVTGKGTPILKQLSWLSKGLFITIAISLVGTLCVILFVTEFQFLGLIFLPAVTTFWADLEMKSAQLEPRRTLLWIAAIASVGLVFGEALDLLLIPSMRY